MKYIKYFTQFVITILSFIIFKFLGPSKSSNLSGKIFEVVGPHFRSKNIIHNNIKNAIPNIEEERINIITKKMWNNYGRIFAEYIFIKDFRSGKLSSNIQINGQEILNEIINQNKQVVFISGHLSNFELMAMHLEKTGIKLSAIYRPLNNIFLNPLMEKIRTKYICKNQIKKGLGGMRKLVELKKKNYSTALMIDQRVSEGIKSYLFKKQAFTTTIPAQLVKKFNIPVVPIFIERLQDVNFRITIKRPINFSNEASIQFITDKLNHELEKMILIKPDQWIWSHNRWK